MSVNENKEKNNSERSTTSGKLFKDVDHFVNEDNQYIFCKYWKPKEDPKALILIVHGYAEHCGRYDRIAYMMNELGFLVFSHDHICHGESEGTKMDILNYKALVRDSLQHVNSMKVKYPGLPIYLFGHSMGGALSIILAHENPDLFKFVVLSSPLIEKNPQSTPILVFFARMLSNIIPRVAVAKLDPNLISRDENKVKAYVNDKLNYVGPVTIRTGRELHQVTVDLAAILPKITFPFVVFHGDADGLAFPKGSEDLMRLSQSTDKSIKLFAGGYHELIHDEKNVPEEFLEDIKQHLLSHM